MAKKTPAAKATDAANNKYYGGHPSWYAYRTVWLDGYMAAKHEASTPTRKPKRRAKK